MQNAARPFVFDWRSLSDHVRHILKMVKVKVAYIILENQTSFEWQRRIDPDDTLESFIST